VDAELRSAIMGQIDTNTTHDCTRYSWWKKHEGSSTHRDRTFKSRRMALLYIAKRNSEELAAYARQANVAWQSLFASEGVHALEPNNQFELEDEFLSMSDDDLQEWSDCVCNAFSRFKVEKGNLFRYTPSPCDVVEVDVLLELLQRDWTSADSMPEHTQRQALLLADIAGFD